MADFNIQEYQAGYTKALLDVYEIFSQYDRQMSKLRIISAPASEKIRKIMDAMIAARYDCMKYGVKDMNLVLTKDHKFRLKRKEPEK